MNLIGSKYNLNHLLHTIHINRTTKFLMGLVDKPLIWALQWKRPIKWGALLQLSNNCVFFWKLLGYIWEIIEPPTISKIGGNGGRRLRRRKPFRYAGGPRPSSPCFPASSPEKGAVLAGDELGAAARSGFLVGGHWVAVCIRRRRLRLEGRRRPWVWMWSGSGAGRTLFSISVSSRPSLRANSISGMIGLYFLGKDLIFGAFGVIFWEFLFIWLDGRTIWRTILKGFSFCGEPWEMKVLFFNWIVSLLWAKTPNLCS